MAENRVPYLLSLINQQIDYQEDLSACLSKAEALAKIALSNDFYDCSDEIQHNYLWALNDIIDNAKTISDKSVAHLFEKKGQQSDENYPEN